MAESLNIKREGFNKRLTTKTSPDGESYDIYFDLSEAPPNEWGKLFERCWQTSKSSKYKRARIEGKYLVIENCPLDWVENFDDKVDSCIQKTNTEYQKIAKQKAKEKSERRKKKRLRRKI